VGIDANTLIFPSEIIMTAEFFSRNLDLVYFFYGLAFVIMGISISIYPRKNTGFKISGIIWLLAGFGIIHGINEWLDLLFHTSRISAGVLKYPRSAFLFLSYILFFEFGRRLINLKQNKLIGGWVTVSLSLLTAVFIFTIREGENIWPRYFLCLPGGLLVSLGTVLYYRNNRSILHAVTGRRYFYSFAAAVFFYGLLGGLISSKAWFFPANLINNSWFMDLTGLPVQFFRALCAVIMAWSTWHIIGIFNWETSERLKKNLNDINSIKAYLDNIIKSIPDSLIVFDVDCKIKMVNGVACSLLGYSEKELIGMPVEDILIDQKVDEIIEEIEDSAFLVSKDFKIIKANTVFLDKILAQPEDVVGKYCYSVTHHIDQVCQLPNDRCPIQELSYTDRPSVAMHTHFGPEGVRKLVNVIAAPVRDDKGNILYYLHISRDCGAAPNEQCLTPGSAGFEFLCNELKGFVDRIEVSVGLLKESREKAAMLMNLKNFETYFHTKSKVAVPVELSNSSITTDKGDLLGFVCIAKDIRTKKELRNIAEEILVARGVAMAERNKAEEVEKLYAELGKSYKRLRVAQSSLIEAEKLHSVGTLAAGVAHEVKNPLAVIFQGIDYLNTNLHSDNNNVKLMLAYIEDAARKADNIIRDLLDFSRLSSPELKLSQINPIIEKSLLLVSHQLDKNNVKVLKEFSPDIPDIVIDSNKIEQALVNLLLNSVNAMNGAGQIKIKTYAHKEEQEDLVLVEIEDSGSGIPQDLVEKIYEPFFTTRRDRGGVGLGLTIVRNIMEMHNAGISIKNRQEGGVVVTIKFKAYKKEDV